MIVRTTKDGQGQLHLTCSECSNTNRFVEIMAEETHLVDGQLNYIRLLDAVVDHYVCCECGTVIKPQLHCGKMKRVWRT